MVHAAWSALDGFYQGNRQRVRVWSVLLLLFLAVLGVREALLENGLIPATTLLPPTTVVLALFFAALACEYIDSSLGMGYGTTLTPMLLLAGYAPAQIVPAVLLSELLTGIAAGVMHQRDGNIDLWRDAVARRTLLLLSLLSTVGALGAVMLAVKISSFWFSCAIAAIVLSMGVLTLATLRRRIRYRSWGVVTIGLVAAFNKGLSGGGYGPLVTSGQLISGVAAKQAVAITSMAEALTCFVGLGAYLYLQKWIDWSLALPLMAGALMSVPMATATVKQVRENVVRGAVGVLTLILGVVLLVKILS